MNKIISIVTVVLNGQNSIRQTIESVTNQDFIDNIEYIVIDGKSTDDTMNIINEYKNKIDVIICEKDKSLFDAMNKAVKIATGEWIFFLNAGDYLLNDQVIRNLFKSDLSSIDVLYGNVIVINNKNLQTTIKPKSILQLYFKMILCHQAAFVKTNLLKNIQEPFEIKYKYAADFKSFRDLLLNKNKFKYINIDVSFYDTNGQSFLNPLEYQKDIIQIIKDSNENKLIILLHKYLSYIFNIKLYLKHKYNLTNPFK